MRPKRVGMKVAMLERGVAERIAAGEVVERPASIVKELVENALDAGASRLRIDLRDGGLESLRVSDDGCGMAREDVELAVQRFATSKIARWEDLELLDTYGFRGEALPSIAAVSRLEIVTRERGASWGWRMVVRGGDVERLEEIGAPPGTTITVTDLFYNTPARKKFLKGAGSEAMRVHELLAAMSLAAPHVQVRFTHNRKELLDLPAIHDENGMRLRLRRIWELPREQQFLPLDLDREGCMVRGWISPPDMLWPNRRRLLLFVNRRLIQMPALSHAVADGMGAGRGHFPMGVLLLTLPSGDVDVNVHPMKSEVRLREGDVVLRRVREAVHQSVQHLPPPPSLFPAPPPDAPWRHAAPPPGADPFAAWPERAPETVLVQEGRICLQHEGCLWIVDPHLWQERRLRRILASQPSGVPLVFPLMVELPGMDVARLQDLIRYGIAIEVFGPHTFLVRTLPEGLERLSAPGLFERVVREERFLEAAACAASVPQGASPDAALIGRVRADLVADDLAAPLGAHGKAAALRLDGHRIDRMLAQAAEPGDAASRQEALQP